MNNYILESPESLFVVIILLMSGIFYKIFFYLGILLLILLLIFYRGWNNIKDNVSENIVYVPAQGKILNIIETDTHVHLSIFLNIHNIHVQYSPMSGIILEINHKNGEFYPAYFFEKSKYNERTITKILTKHGVIYLYQIAGQIARRIKTFKKEGNSIKTLEPLGLIKLGSRCDLFVPKKGFVLNKNLQKGNSIDIGDILGYYKN